MSQQPGLFTVEEEKAAAPKEESVGKRAKKAYAREREYQKVKAETVRLQRQWEKSRPEREAERERARAQSAELEKAAPQIVTLVSCVSRKLPVAAQARELYVSDWFKKARAYAEKTGDGWFILSAFYGLLAPDRVIEPYERTLNGQREKERRAWAARVAADLRRSVPPGSRLIILAGELYRRELIPLLNQDYRIEVPMRGLGIGQQLSFLKKAVE